MSKIIEAKFQVYIKTVYDEPPLEHQIDECRKAFFAGACIVLTKAQQGSVVDLISMQAEVYEYFRMIESQAVTMQTNVSPNVIN